jgi:arylsulfatase
MANGKKPNILVIFGDDIGIPQISAHTMGLMGYRTPNIDRIAKEGALFTDSCGQQSCTAGRASFILGQEPFRTGLLTIGMPGDPHGITDWMPAIADVMKTQGYATGQFGKNHLGDQDHHLPTNHGFDEFFGNLYHLNAEQEPETYFYPKAIDRLNRWVRVAAGGDSKCKQHPVAVTANDPSAPLRLPGTCGSEGVKPTLAPVSSPGFCGPVSA